MKYCKHCGKQLADNQMCDCPGSIAERNSENSSFESANNSHKEVFESKSTSENTNDSSNYQSRNFSNSQKSDDSVEINIDVDKIKGSLSSVIKSGINAFINPYSYGSTYINSLNYKNSGIIMFISALVTGIFTIIIASKINSGADQFFATLFENMGYHDTILPIGKSLILSIIFSMLISLILAVLNFIINIVFKVGANYEKSMAYASLRSTYTIPVKILAIIIAIINPKYGLIIFFMSYFLVSFSINASILANNSINQNKIARSSILIRLLFFFIFVAIAKFALSKMMTPAYFNDISYQLFNLINF